MNTIKHRYFDCVDDKEVWLYEVQNGTHDWPAYSSEEIWNFFSEYIVLFLGDINNDGSTDILDVVIVINFALSNEYNSSADLNSDSTVDVLDIVQLVNIILN